MGGWTRLGTVIAFCLFGTTLASTPGQAQDRPEFWTIACVFNLSHALTITGSSVQTNSVSEPPYRFTFADFDSKKGTVAVVGGNTGHFWLTEWKLVIINMSLTGNPSITSMSAPKNGSPMGAAHSEHTWMLGTARIMQWAGQCNLRK
jgi:hypothetical protein